MLDIQIHTIPAHIVRADQSGDWSYGENVIRAYVVADTYPPESELMIGIHELIEAWLCRKHGVSEEAVVKFDEMYEDERKAGHHKDSDEPGDDPRSPYRLEHQAATHVERAVGAALNVTWREHEQLVTDSAGPRAGTSGQIPVPPESVQPHQGVSLAADQPSSL